MNLLEKITVQEKVDLVKNLSLLIKSGKPVNECFYLLARQEKNPALKNILNEAKDKTEKGTPLYEIFDQSSHFGSVFVSFIRAGEESGSLDENLVYLADWLDRENKLKKEVRAATIYPKIIIAFTVILGSFLSVFVLPDIMSVFEDLNVDKPITTEFLISISNLMRESGLFILGGIFLLVVLGYLLSKLKPVKRIWDHVVLKLPLVGATSKDYQLTIISQLIATLFKAGLTTSEALEIIIISVTNMRYKEALQDMRERVLKGTSFAKTIEAYPDLFPSSFASIITTGEETGSYDESFQHLANFFAERVREKTQRLPIILEPMLLILIGLIVAFIASAIILPIYDVTSGLQMF